MNIHANLKPLLNYNKDIGIQNSQEISIVEKHYLMVFYLLKKQRHDVIPTKILHTKKYRGIVQLLYIYFCLSSLLLQSQNQFYFVKNVFQFNQSFATRFISEYSFNCECISRVSRSFLTWIIPSITPRSNPLCPGIYLIQINRFFICLIGVLFCLIVSSLVTFSVQLICSIFLQHYIILKACSF